MITSCLNELYERSSVLTLTGAFHLVVLAGCVVGLATDSRTVLGINPWIKPAKFAASITIFVWTMAWLLAYLPDYPRATRFIRWGITSAMLVEIVCICLQSYRGVPSHFNISTPFDGVIFGLMGLAILVNTLLVVWALVLFFRQTPVRSQVYILSIRLGIIVFLVGSYIGRVMVANTAHTVGDVDGGPGLPFLNWSTLAGDLRVAHAFGLHALQLLPLVGFVLSRWDIPESRQRILVWAVSIVYAGLVFWTYTQALAGHPLISRGSS